MYVKSLNDIKFHDDFESLFSELETKEFIS